jgi:FMN reductase
MKVVAINGSPTAGRTKALAVAAVELAGGDASLLDVAELDGDALLFRGEHPSVDAAVASLVAADVLVIVTPMYRATYSGVLKCLFDLLPTGALAGTACVLAATGGSRDHFLALDTGLRSMIASLDGWSVPTVVYATGEDVDPESGPTDEVRARLQRALDEAATVVT